MSVAPAPTASRIPRWDSRPSHASSRPGDIDFGQWHKDALPSDSYCMDVDKVEYRIGADGNLRVVGIYELIRWGWHHDIDDIPEMLAPYEGKLKLLGSISRLVAESQGEGFPAFIVWHRPDLSEFVVSRLEEWAGDSRKGLCLGGRAFAELVRRLPKW